MDFVTSCIIRLVFIFASFRNDTFTQAYHPCDQSSRILVVRNKIMIGRQLQSRHSHQRFVSQFERCRKKQSHLTLLSVSDERTNETPSSSSSSTTSQLLNGVFARIDRTLSYKTEQSRSGNGGNSKDATDIDVTEALRDITSNIREKGSKPSLDNTSKETVNEMMKNVETRSIQTIESSGTPKTRSTADADSDVQHQHQKHPDYSTNPTITTTALAHSLWSYVLRPGVDVAIDATAGNGYDSFAMANMLFPQYVIRQNSSEKDNITDSNSSAGATRSMLYAIDVQLTACQNTTERLSSILPPHIMSNHVQIWHTSHETLPILNDNNNVALIVYNLGFLPGSHSKGNDKSITTKTITTITSMGNAISLLRIGGLLSVTTYPRTNHQEDNAVQVFMETLALFSSQTQSWTKYLECVHLHNNNNDNEDKDDNSNVAFSSIDVRDHLIQTLQQVYDDNPYQKWRVTQHKKLGRIDAPILFTAVRIQ